MDYSMLVMLLKDLVILPFQDIKIELKDEISKKIIKVSSKKYNNRVLIVSPDTDSINPSIKDLPNVGVVAVIKSKLELSNGNLRLTLRGEKRVKILNYKAFNDDIISAYVCDIILPKFEVKGENVIKTKLKEILNAYIESSPNISNSILKVVDENDDLGFLSDAITTFLPFKVKQKLNYMQEVNPEKRALSLIKDIKLEIRYNELEEKIDNNVEIRLTKEQEEYYLKEKIKELESNLGKDAFNDDKITNYLNKLNSLDIDKKIYNKLKENIDHLKNLTTNSPEHGVLENYLDWTLNLPWNTLSKENLNVKSVLTKLNKSHYGLDEIKRRIEDYINIKNINPNINSPIICLVGPPGIGKTTITESIAQALNREYYKISVGGLNDSTELVGSRRTYLGSLPGKIIQAIKKCNTKNPVILIDEVDKMVRDYKGDPASTLLDILDSTQNKHFIDNYIEEPFDLSQIMFVLTANDTKDIPYALYDRLEIIELSSYDIFEKVDIAKKYILPKIYDEFDMKRKINIKDETIMYIINNYTKEAGVRELERVLKKLITKVITSSKSLSVSEIEVVKYLKEGEKLENKEITESGVVNILAYTNIGGEVTRIECAIFNGDEKVILTGQLGDVLKESVMVAISYIREKNYVSNTLFYNHTVHIHFLESAIKKDGPSCGVAIVSVILSKLLDIPISNEISFTGEISLKGDLIKVGGIKEKLISAYNYGIKKVYIPKDNEKDLKNMPKTVLDNLEIKLIKNYDTIFNDLFNKEKK